MRRNALLGVAVALSAMLAVAVLAQPPEVGPGGVWIQGSTDEYSSFYLRIGLRQAEPGLFTILAAKVYSEPSHTLLVAIVDGAAPALVLTSVNAEKPRATMVTTISAVQSDLHLGIPAPPATDSRIRIDYVIRKGKSVSTITMSDAQLSSLSDFEFSSAPTAGGGYHNCGSCGGSYCGCVDCSTPAWTLCCPSCTISCGAVKCPGE
ncbi:MAG: hypothetical protein WBS54_13970 [Acidobacteriota bacterium]